MEFCEITNAHGRYYIEDNSNITRVSYDSKMDIELDRNLLYSEKEAEAHLALMQLRSLRKHCIGCWEPDWDNFERKWVIKGFVNSIKIDYEIV